jgi:hypothetical protein
MQVVSIKSPFHLLSSNRKRPLHLLALIRPSQQPPSGPLHLGSSSLGHPSLVVGIDGWQMRERQHRSGDRDGILTWR